jgi:hypothetical protein
MSASAPKPFLATAMGGIVITIGTLIVVAGGFVALLAMNAHHEDGSQTEGASSGQVAPAGTTIAGPSTGDPAAP